MRKIKFRAWDMKKQIFMPSGDIIFSNYGDTRITVSPNCIEYIGDSCHNYNEENRFKIMEYTGLKDKNGLEIYEGDIIKYDFNNLNYRIEFINAEFIARRFYENIENLYPTEFDYGRECEVIGNIYENPELL